MLMRRLRIAVAPRRAADEDKSGWYMTPAGWLVAVLVIGGGIVFFVAPGAVAGIGAFVAIMAVLVVIGDRLPAGIGGGWVIGKGRTERQGARDPQPEYIARTVEPPDELWDKVRDQSREPR
jgi:hypothetical protein